MPTVEFLASLGLQPGYHPPPLWQDPRPDLEGSGDWERLLRLAYEMFGEDVAGVLNGVRSGGAVLVQGKRGIRIEPVIDAERGWWPPELYAEVRERYMLPIRDEIARCLDALEKNNRVKG